MRRWRHLTSRDLCVVAHPAPSEPRGCCPEAIETGLSSKIAHRCETWASSRFSGRPLQLEARTRAWKEAEILAAYSVHIWPTGCIMGRPGGNLGSRDQVCIGLGFGAQASLSMHRGLRVGAEGVGLSPSSQQRATQVPVQRLPSERGPYSVFDPIPNGPYATHLCSVGSSVCVASTLKTYAIPSPS